LTGSAGIPRRKYRHRCSSKRGAAAFTSVTSAADHNRSATEDARGHVREITFVASTYSKQLTKDCTTSP